MTDLQIIVNGYMGSMERIARKSCGEISQRVRDRTPVLSGELKLSWVVDPHPSQIKQGDIFRMGTDSPYARFIEYLSPPARNHPITRYQDVSQPYGMMRRSIAEWQQIVDEAVRGS